MKTKGGKAVNPTDAYRKELRKKELKRNKKERKKVREVGILKKDPETLKDQIKKLDAQNTDADGALDKTRRHKKRQLEDTLNLVLKKQKEYADKMTEKGEDPVMFSHLPTHRPGDEDADNAQAAQDSAYYQPAVNPTGPPLPGKQPMYRTAAPELNMSVPLPPPPPPPPLPVSKEVNANDKLDPLSVPVPPPPPAPPRLPPLTSVPPPPPPPPRPAGEASASGVQETSEDDRRQSSPEGGGEDDNSDDDEKAASVPQIAARPPLLPQPPVQVMLPPRPPPAPPRLPLAPPAHFAYPPPPAPPVVGIAYGGVPSSLVRPAAAAAAAADAAPSKTDKPFYVKSAAPTATKRPLAQHTPGLTAMVPASVRVKREAAPKVKARPSAPAATAPVPKPTAPPVKPQSMDDSYSAFLEDMKALGAFDDE